MRKKISVLFTFILMLCIMVCLGVTANATEVTKTSKCGENAYWNFNKETGTLTISGTGKIDDAVLFDEETGTLIEDEGKTFLVNMPWYNIKNQIKTLVIEEGITEIGACAFYGLYYLTEVKLPSTLEVVGCAAFCDCIRLENLDFPDSVKTLYVSNYNEISIKKIVLPKSLKSTPIIPGIDEAFDFNMCAYLESITIPEEIGSIEAIVSAVNPSIRNIYNYSTEAIVKFDNRAVSQYWYGDEATAEYATVAMGAALESIEYDMTDEELEAFVLEKIIEYYGEDYAEKIPYPNLIETVPNYIKVYCYENSAQHLYCVDNNINFILIDENTHLDALNNDGVCDVCGLNNMCGEKVYYEFDEETGTLTIKGEGEMYNYSNIPESLFKLKDSVVKVVIEDGITSLSEYLFFGWDYIKEFSVDENNQFFFSDEAGVLYNKERSELIYYPIDSNISEYTIPETVSSLSSGVFYSCKNLKVLNITGKTIYIDGNFYGSSIETFNVAKDNAVYSSDEYGVLFNNDKTVLIKYPEGNKAKSYTVPDSVKIIDELSIHLCEYLEEIYIGSNVSHINVAALSRNVALKKIAVDEANLNYSTDEYGVLFNKDKTILYQYTIGSTKASYVIPETVTKLTGSAFEESRYLDTILIPSSVVHIEDWVFPGHYFNCVYFTGTEEQWNSIIVEGYNDNLTVATIYYNYNGTPPIITKSGYCGDNVTYELTYAGVLTIRGTGAMSDNLTIFNKYNIKNVVIEDGVTSIGSWAFSRCDDLESVTIPNSVTIIGDSAFSGCKNLASIAIPDSVTSIGKAAFFGCESIINVTIPNKVTSIGDVSFYACKSLASITLSTNITSIGESAFDGCNNITDLYYDGSEKAWDNIDIKSGNDPLLNAPNKHFRPCRHTDDGYETIIRVENLNESTYLKDGSYDEVTVCANCDAELSRVQKVTPDLSIIDTMVDSFKGFADAIAGIITKFIEAIVKQWRGD